MSKQSNIGKLMYDVRDVLSNDVTSTVLRFALDRGMDRNDVLNLVKELKGDVHKAFDRGTDAVLKQVK